MRIRVLYFGMIRDIIGSNSEEKELPTGAAVSDLMAILIKTFPALEKFNGILAISVNREFARANHVLQENDEVGLLPPVSGGNHQQRVSITSDPIDQAAVLRAIKHHEDGAIALFDGIVRNNSRGRSTEYLVYDAYTEMALKQMEVLAARAMEQYKVRDVRIIHRIGRLEIGETSVVIVVASAHRAAAFDACRWLIDTLKKTVPIWKKEHFTDGAVWADGEPFPKEILPAPSTPEAGKASK